MAAPKPFPSNLWRKEPNVPRWTFSLKWSAEIVRTKKGWRANAAMKPFLQLQSEGNYDSKEDAINGIQCLFEGFYINPWESGVASKCNTSIHQCLELIKTKDNTWVLYSTLDEDYGYEFDTKEEAQRIAEYQWINRFLGIPE